MSEVELSEGEAKDENPSEPIADIATVAEPGQPAEPEDLPEIPPTQVQNQEVLETGALSVEKLEEETAMVRSETLSVARLPRNKFTQTFFKYMKNLSDKRCLEIFHSEVDHEDKSLVFYRRSAELLDDPWMRDL